MSLASLAVRALAARAGRWSFSHAARRGRQAGHLLYRLDRRHREVALNNLERAFPERDADWRERVALGSFEQVGRTALETLWAGRLSADRLRSAFDPEDFEPLRDRLADGRGAILASAHFGNWELTGIAFGALGIPCVSVARRLDDPDLDRLLNHYRTRTGSEVVYKQDALRAALRALRDGKAVALLMDQNTQRHEAVFVPFFERAAATPPAVAHLHLRTGAPIIACHPVPAGDRYRLDLHQPELPQEGDREQRVVGITKALVSRLEALVRTTPHAWLWLHDRWRERPQPGRES